MFFIKEFVMIEYSIVIRTLGTAGEKYLALLNSIKKLNIQPKEILVVLPEGYNPPKEQLGYEKFIYSPKGMVAQRVFGGQAARSKYILFLDDDVTFETNFIEKLSYPIEAGLCAVTVPAPVQLPPEKGLTKIIPSITMSAVSLKRNKGYFTRIIRSGGWTYSRYNIEHKPYLYTHSASGICCFCLNKIFNLINFSEDLWLQGVRYPLWEDQVMYYKFWKNGFKVMCVPEAAIEHLDAGGNSEGRAKDAAFANGRNKVIFWYKYIYKDEKSIFYRALDKMCLFYHLYSNILFLWIADFRKSKQCKIASSYLNGVKEGFRFIHENE